MSTILSSQPETSIWSAPSAPIKLHSRARETETACCAGVTFTKSLERTEIPLSIYDSRDGLGLFSQDPIGFVAGDANLYRYVGNSPTNATDPSGLAETTSPSRGSLINEAANSMTDDERLANWLSSYDECSCQSPLQHTNGRDPGSMRALTDEEIAVKRARTYRRLLEREHSLNTVLEATGIELIGMRNELNALWDSEFPEGRNYRNLRMLEFHSQRVGSSLLGTVRPSAGKFGTVPPFPTQPFRPSPVGRAAKSLSETGHHISDFIRTDIMSKNQLANLVKDIEKYGFQNPVIEYAMIGGKPFVMRGSNRIQAAKQLPARRNELRFKEVSIEFGGYKCTDDVIGAAFRATGRNPFE